MSRDTELVNTEAKNSCPDYLALESLLLTSALRLWAKSLVFWTQEILASAIREDELEKMFRKLPFGPGLVLASMWHVGSWFRLGLEHPSGEAQSLNYWPTRKTQSRVQALSDLTDEMTKAQVPMSKAWCLPGIIFSGLAAWLAR